MSVTQESKTEAKYALDLFASRLLELLNVKAKTLISAMQNRIGHDHEQIELLEKRQAELSTAYNQYLDVQKQIKEHEQSIEKIGGLVGYSLYGNVDDPQTSDEADEHDQQRRWRDNLQLWEAIEQYLRFVPERESRVREIMEFLELVEFECSRQSIEAAIKAHPKVFRIQKRKNEKFISLKGV
jgi:hypothetical protein